MKTIILLLIAIMPLIGLAQVLKENKTDEFTKASIKRTSWESLKSDFKRTAHFRISEINNTIFFNYKNAFGTHGQIYSVNKDNSLMLKLDNDSIIDLKNLEYSITCTGCGAIGFAGSQIQGTETNYLLNNVQIATLKNHRVVKIRFYTNDGFDEFELNENNSLKIQNAINLIF